MKHLLSICFLFLTVLNSHADSLPCGGSGSRQVAAAYTAADGKQLQTCFDLEKNRVVVRLTDGEMVTLPIATSASGSRYSDEQRTFWEHQGVGRYFIGEKLLFEGTSVSPAGYNGGVTSKVLKKVSVTANGQKISYPVTDKAEVTAVLVEVAAGAETGWHQHAIPVYAYMLDGELEVWIEGGATVVYKPGEVIIEVVNTFHTGKNNGKVPARLVAFYTGIAGQPNVLRK